MMQIKFSLSHIYKLSIMATHDVLNLFLWTRALWYICKLGKESFKSNNMAMDGATMLLAGNFRVTVVNREIRADKGVLMIY